MNRKSRRFLCRLTSRYVGILVIAFASDGAAQSVLWGDDFEPSIFSYWRVENGIWEMGAPLTLPIIRDDGSRAHQGSNCAATVLLGNYPPNTSSRLVGFGQFIVPPVNQHPRLQFWHRYAFSGNSYGVVQILRSNGNWTDLSPRYYHTGSGAWTRPIVELGAYAGQAVRIAFQIVTDDNVNDGWYVDEIQVVTGALQTLSLNVAEGFEAGMGDWSAESGTWEVGPPTNRNGPPADARGLRTHGGTNCLATVLDNNYEDDNSSRFISPPFLVPPSDQYPRLRFWHWWNFGDQDFGQVQIKIGGNDWQPLAGNFSNSGGWAHAWLDLNAFAGQSVQLGFNFSAHRSRRASDGSWYDSVSAGWYIDDVIVETGVGATWYVSATLGNDAYNGKTWATAKQTIQAAVDGAADGDKVIVTNGLYQIGERGQSRLIADKPIRVESVNGPLVTLIAGRRASIGADSYGSGADALNCVSLGNAAVLAGFTLTNGHVRTRLACGGGVLGISSASLSNCVIVGSSASVSSYGGGAAYVRLDQCTLANNQAGSGGGAYACDLANCILIANSADGGSGSGGGAWQCTLSNSFLKSNLALIGGGAADSALYNCQLIGNHGAIGGGFADSSGFPYEKVLYNCLITHNVAERQGGGMSGGCLINCTVADNRAGTPGQAGEGGGCHGCCATNCIIYFNTIEYNSTDMGSNYDGGTFANSCTAPYIAGGNITSAPLFINRLAGDYRLAANSPCIDAGMNLDWMVGLTDLGGNLRIRGEAIDLGAFEDQTETVPPGPPEVVFSNFGPGYGYNPSRGWTIYTNINGTAEEAMGFVPPVDSYLQTIHLAVSLESGLNELDVSLLTWMPAPILLESFHLSGAMAQDDGVVHAPLRLNSQLHPLLKAGHTYWLTASQAGNGQVSYARWKFNSTGASGLIGGRVVDADGNDTGWSGATALDPGPGAFEITGIPAPAPVLAIRAAGANIILTWSRGSLQSASQAGGPFSKVNGAISPYTHAAWSDQQFYRLMIP